MVKKFIRQWRIWGLIALTVFVVACAQSDNPNLEDFNLENSDGNSINMLVADTPLQLNRITAGFTALATEGNLLVIEIQWSIVSKPANSRAVIINPASPTPSFRPDIVGEYVLRVIISQGGSMLADNEVTIIAGVNDLFPSKPVDHIVTTDDCLACHVQGSWIISIMDHTQVVGTCISCHDGITASGKSVNHLGTTLDCIACHGVPPKSTWIYLTTPIEPNPPPPGTPPAPAGPPVPPPPAPPAPPGPPVDHQGFVGNCIQCHNGKDAMGLSVNHIPTSSSCDSCHVIAPASWLQLVGVDHTQVVGTCVSCHDGNTATGKSPSHMATTEVCQACHLTWPNAWLPVTPSQVDHNEVLGMCSSSCHTMPRLHVAAWYVCDDCHITKDWLTIIGP